MTPGETTSNTRHHSTAWYLPAVDRDGLAGCCWKDEPCGRKPRCQEITQLFPSARRVSQSVHKDHERIWIIGSNHNSRGAQTEICTVCHSSVACYRKSIVRGFNDGVSRYTVCVCCMHLHNVMRVLSHAAIIAHHHLPTISFRTAVVDAARTDPCMVAVMRPRQRARLSVRAIMAVEARQST